MVRMQVGLLTDMNKTVSYSQIPHSFVNNP